MKSNSVLLPWIIAAFCFVLAYLLLAQIESTTQIYCGGGFVLIGVVIIFAQFWKPDPNAAKKKGFHEAHEFFNGQIDFIKKELKKTAEQEQLESRVGQRPVLSADGRSKEWVERGEDGKYFIKSEPLRRFEK